MRKDFNCHRVGLGHQHGRRFIVLEQQCSRRDVMWKRPIARRISAPGTLSFLKWQILCFLFIHPSVHSFIHSFIHSSFIHSFIHSFIQSFIYFQVVWIAAWSCGMLTPFVTLMMMTMKRIQKSKLENQSCDTFFEILLTAVHISSATSTSIRGISVYF